MSPGYPVYQELDKMNNKSTMGVNGNRQLFNELQQKIDWSKYLEYGTIELQIRKSKVKTLAVKHTLQDEF